MAPTPDELSPPGSSTYDSNTLVVGDGTWDFTMNTFLLPNLQPVDFETMRYNGMGNRFSTLNQYHTIIIAHGVLAAIAFLFLVPVSVMMARFWGGGGRPGLPVKFHSQFHIFAGLLLLAVFMTGYLAVGPQRRLTNPHHGIGTAIFVLFILQLLGGWFIRGITSARSLRRTIHQWSGRCIALLGIVQVPLGLVLYGSPKWIFIVYAVWMAFLFVTYFILDFRAPGRHEVHRSGRSEAGHTRVTESGYFPSEPKPSHGSKWKWLGPLAAGGALWAFMGRKKGRDRSRSPSPSYRSHDRSHAPEVVPSRRGSASYYDDDKYSASPPPKKSGFGGGLMKTVGGAAAAIGAGKLFSSFMNRRDRPRDEEYSALSTETPRRHRPSRMPGPHSDLSTELTEDTPRGDPTATSLLTPNPNQPAMMAGALGAAGSRPGHQRPLTPPQSRRPGRRHSFDDTEYSSYVSPSRRLPEDTPAKAGGLGKGILAGMGLGWIGKKLADRRSKKDEERRLQEEDDMRSGLSGSRFTGDGFPSPTRRPSRRPPVRRQTGFNPATTQTEMTESSIDSRPPVTSRPTAGGGRSHSRSRSRTHIEPATMPALPGDPGGIFSEGETSLTSKQSAAQRRTSSRRRRDGEMATAAAAARAAELAADESPSRSRYASPHSQPVSMKLRVHDDKDRKVTLRMLSEEEARRERGGSHSRADSESSLSGLESPSYGRGRYRRDSSQRRAEAAAERRAEASGAAGDALEPPNPAFAKTARRSAAQKDSAYYSGGGAGGAAGGTAQAGPSGSTPAAGQTVSSLGSLASPESHGTWSAMSPSPGDKPGQSSAAAADNRRRRRLERRRGSSSRPSGTDMFD